MEEIGRGSFATVYKATHTVSILRLLRDKLWSNSTDATASEWVTLTIHSCAGLHCR